MSSQNQPPGRALTLIECLTGLGCLLGAGLGCTWGAGRYGVVGALVGLPAGMVVGLIMAVAGMVALAAVMVAVLAVRALIVGGPKGLMEFLRHGPEALRENDPPAHRPDQTGG
ncbi:MAG: hypothetical protein JWO38_1914 [Gemmataceae bacterium]|nr:hypothetical protein [Gemmataceae bacterium]